MSQKVLYLIGLYVCVPVVLVGLGLMALGKDDAINMVLGGLVALGVYESVMFLTHKVLE